MAFTGPSLDLIRRVATLVEQITQGDGFLPADSHSKFWRAVTNPSIATAYTAVLVVKLLLLETQSPDFFGTQRSLRDVVCAVVEGTWQPQTELVALMQQNASGGNALMPETLIPAKNHPLRDFLISTIYFLAINFSLETHPALTQILSVWNASRTNTSRCAMNEAIKFVTAAASNLNTIHNLDNAVALVEQLSNLEVASNFTLDGITCEEIAPSFLHSLLRRALHMYPQKTAGVIAPIMLFLNNPGIVESRLHALLHIITMVVTTGVPLEPRVLQDLINSIKPYYLWPRPISDVARELLQMLSFELKHPGSAMRARLFDEVPELTRGYKPHGKERTVHVLVDRNTQFGQRCQSILQNTFPRDVTLRELQTYLLCQFFDTYHPLASLDELGLDAASDEDLASYYMTALEVLNRSKRMPEEDAAAFRKEKYELLREFIVLRIPETARAGCKSTRPTGNLWPALKLDFLPVSCPPHEQPASHFTKAQYPYRPSADALLHVFKSYANLGLTEKVTVRIAIAGNDQTLHSIIGSYVAIKANYHDIMSHVRPVFYFLPMERSNFSNFLCGFDMWYARHVVALCHGSLRVLPMLASKFGELTAQSFTSGGSNVENRQRQLTITQGAQVSIDAVLGAPASVALWEIPSPSMALRAELAYYFTEARYSLPINIYQCETWSRSNTYVTRIFLQRCEIGCEPFVAAFRRANALPDDMPVEEVQKQFKTFKYLPTPLALKMTQMSISGAARQATAVEYRGYQSLLVSSVSWDPSRLSPVNPVDPWVEVATVEGDAKKRKKLSDKHIYHVSSIDVEADKSKGVFEVLLDGCLYTDLVRLKISLCADPTSGDIINLPMNSFVPHSKIQVGVGNK